MPTRRPGNKSTENQGRIARRTVLQSAAAAATLAIVPRHVLGGPGHVPPSQKTTLAGIGVGGQGMQNMDTFQQMPEVQVVAVCDVNRDSGGYLSWNWDKGKEQRHCGREPARRATDAYYAKQRPSGKYKGCRAYVDFRELLAKEDVDAVMIATPDHSHATITMAALKRGKHVYCEKPLTYSVAEARLVAETAKKMKVATQLGNQGQATEEARVVCEMVAAGAIGAVREVYATYGTRFWPYPNWEGRPKETPPVPDGLDWDLWLGPAPERPYHPCYCPWTWRNWWDFGTGLLGDLFCHMLSATFKALKLGSPTSVEASSTRIDSDIYPLSVVAHFEFPARGDMPPVDLHWYDGGVRPPRPKALEPGRRPSGVILVGAKGTMMGHRLIPAAALRKFGRPPRILPRSPGHYQEFIDACRGGPPPGSNFVDHAGLLTEACLLANVSLRAQKQILFDGPNMKITNDADANKFLSREYRSGWTL